MNQICLAKAKVLNGEKDIDLESLYKYEADNKVEQYCGLMQRSICEILLNLDNQHIAETENWIKKAIKANTINGKRWYLGRDYVLYYDCSEEKTNDQKPKNT